MIDSLVVRIDDIIGHPEGLRPVSGSRDVTLRLGETVIDGPMDVSGEIAGTIDGVHARFTVSASATLTCSRCLTTWEERLETDGEQHFNKIPDEDGYAIESGVVDVGVPATDELALALPAAPVCQPNCMGLCPTCGTDLNSDPCDGHGDDSDSPFASLRDLFDS